MDRQQRPYRATGRPIDDRPAATLAHSLQECPDCSGIEVIGARIDVAEYRPSAESGDAAAGCKESERARDDFLTRADVTPHHREQQGVGPGRHTDALGGTAIGGDFCFQSLDLRAKHELLAGADPHQRCFDLGTQRTVLGSQIEQGYRGIGHCKVRATLS